jgi:hypothetical protein
LLAVGMIRKSAALRWTSLTRADDHRRRAARYDLAPPTSRISHVASLVGLAFSLI